MKKILYVIPLLTALTAHADDTDPFDFNYVVEGRQELLNVFNDGKRTYISTKDRAPILIKNENVTQRGSYYVIEGVKPTIEGFYKNDPIKILWTGQSQSIMDDAGEVDHEQYGSFGRLALLNEPRDEAVVAILPNALQLREAIKAISPKGWTGQAEKDIDITALIRTTNKVGESWLIVLDRILSEVGLYAEIDTRGKKIMLRTQPTKASLNAANKRYTKNSKSIVGDFVGDTDSPITTSQVSIADQLLSDAQISKFKLVGSEIQILLKRSAESLTVRDAQTQQMIPVNKVSPVLFTVPRTAHFIVEVPAAAPLEVKYMLKRNFKFDTQHSMGLKSVKVVGSTVYFAFNTVLNDLTMFDARDVALNGLWEGNTFKIDDTPSSIYKLMTPNLAMYAEVVSQPVFLWRASTLQRDGNEKR